MRALFVILALAVGVAAGCSGGDDDDCVVTDEEYARMQRVGEDAAVVPEADAGPITPDAGGYCHCC